MRSGRWAQLLPTVFRLVGAPETWRQRAVAVCLHLGPGAVLSHRAAAALRQGPGRRPPPPVEVIVSRGRNRAVPADVIVHTTARPLPSEDVTTIDGIPVTSPARTLLDLAAVKPEPLISRALDDAARRGQLKLSRLPVWLDDPVRARHPGAALLRRVVADRLSHGVTESDLEVEVLALLRTAGFPSPVRQHEIWDQDRLVRRVDLAYPEARIAIEADGFRHHDLRDRFDAERARGNDLEALGWHVLRVTHQHLTEDPQSVVRWVKRALADPLGG